MASGEGWLPNPLDEHSQDVTFGAWARLVNFKANHRKVIIGDDGAGGLVGIVASANPHDGSSAHSNVAAKIAGPALAPLLASEMDVARFSGWQGVIAVEPSRARAAGERLHEARPAGRSCARGCSPKARSATRWSSTSSRPCAARSIDIAMFYISDRTRHRLAASTAAARGVNVRLILDPNKDAFGYEKNGIPNRPVASELVAASNGAIHVRWYRTHGEQFHTKLVMVYGADRVWMSLGSANLTRRNIGGLQPRSERRHRDGARLTARRAGAGVLRHAVEQPRRRSASSTRRTSASTPTRRRPTTGSIASWSRRGCRRFDRGGAAAAPCFASAMFAAFSNAATTALMRFASASATPSATKLVSSSRPIRRAIVQSSVTYTLGAAPPPV